MSAFDPEVLKRLADGPGPNVQPSTVRALAADLLAARARIADMERSLEEASALLGTSADTQRALADRIGAKLVEPR